MDLSLSKLFGSYDGHMSVSVMEELTRLIPRYLDSSTPDYIKEQMNKVFKYVSGEQTLTHFEAITNQFEYIDLEEDKVDAIAFGRITWCLAHQLDEASHIDFVSVILYIKEKATSAGDLPL